MTNDLRFAGKLPVVINRSGDVRDIFAPLRTTSCDISIVSNRILADLYTNDKKGICVKVEKINRGDSITSTLFEGYMTHNTYSQHLSPNLDNIDMTAIDPIALLKYVYIDDILEKSRSLTIGEFISKSLGLVKIDCNYLDIEQTVEYNDSDGAKTTFVDMLIQTNNFWDEGGDASTVYDALSECLRLFGYQMCFTGDRYMIYLAVTDHNFGTNYRYFKRYIVEDGGTLTALDSLILQLEMSKYMFSKGEWTPIDDNPTLSIDETYDKISCVASTKVPDFSTTAFDMITSEDRDKYDVGSLNIQCNKIKGYKLSSDYSGGGVLITNDEWFYIWNGVYISPDYKLDITGVDSVNGYANINNAYSYLTGNTGHPNAYGGVLNFYGGADNPTATGREQVIERSVDVKECITVFAPDNGTAPEFLERDDLAFTYEPAYDEYSYATLTKVNSTDSKFGSNKTGSTERIAYSQKYENITVMKEAEQTLVIDLSHSYSRTGFNQSIPINNYSTMENKVFRLYSWGDGEDSGGTGAGLISGMAYTYPYTWYSNSVSVNSDYWNKNTISGITLPANEFNVVTPVWDKRRVIVYVRLLDGTIYQFNGKEWVETEYVTKDNSFYLKKLMNGEKLFHTDFQYNLIECADGDTYSLNEEGYTYQIHEKSGAVLLKNKGKDKTFKYYLAAGNEWVKYIDKVSEGQISIILPPVNGVNVTVGCDIYTSNLLGMTGNKNNGGPSNVVQSVYYSKTGKVKYEDDYGNVEYGDLNGNIIEDYGRVYGAGVEIIFLPVNATYIKAEHLDLDISLSVPETNLGQMFGESDIKYQTTPSKRFREIYEAPDFKVNTKHPIVSQSHSYLIIGNELADPNKFSMGWNYNKIACRPENYVLQGYKNFYGTIRKTYNRVLVPLKEGFSNMMCYIEAFDIPDTGNGRTMVVVSDSVDVKTNRHTISAVEDYGIKVDDINNYTVIEIPRKARNERYNLPSVKK